MSHILQIVVVPNGKVTGLVLTNWKIPRNIMLSVKFCLKLIVRMLINLVLCQLTLTPTVKAAMINQKSVLYAFYHLKGSKLVARLRAIIAFVWNVYWNGVKTLTLVPWIVYPSLRSLLEIILMAR